MYTIAAYTHTESEVREINSLFEVPEYLNRYSMVWLDITRPTREDIDKLGEIFGFHQLALDDCLHITQRAKVDNYGDYVFLIIKAAEYTDRASTYQISMFLGKNYLVTIREADEKHLAKPIFEKIALKNQTVVKNGGDYVVYLLIDHIVDDYFPIFDRIDDEIEEIERNIVENLSKDSINDVFRLKRQVLVLRKAIFPTMEMILCIQRGDLPHISKKTLLFFSDVYDHAAEVVDLLETSRELISGAIDLYMSKTQNTINEVAKMFAMFAIILMWPTVIGALYGMNFEFPEKKWFGDYAYFFALALMAVLMTVTWIYFKIKRWV